MLILKHSIVSSRLNKSEQQKEILKIFLFTLFCRRHDIRQNAIQTIDILQNRTRNVSSEQLKNHDTAFGRMLFW
jgi:hypothetical protein